ncbi:hypothetical protein HDU76_010556, partial [Blyttiomyces sp. JEL0837]
MTTIYIQQPQQQQTVILQQSTRLTPVVGGGGGAAVSTYSLEPSPRYYSIAFLVGQKRPTFSEIAPTWSQYADIDPVLFAERMRNANQEVRKLYNPWVFGAAYLVILLLGVTYYILRNVVQTSNLIALSIFWGGCFIVIIIEIIWHSMTSMKVIMALRNMTTEWTEGDVVYALVESRDCVGGYDGL